MKLLHYHETPVALDRQRTYPQCKPRTFGKPNGLWVSVKGLDDWQEWCTSEGFRTHQLAVAHKVTLTDSANVLHISRPAELDEFHRQWSIETDYLRRDRESLVEMCGERFTHNQRAIDWGKVAAQWDGIIIAPYLWSRRLDGPHWYYGWDCASGCIWNLAVVDRFEVVIDK